MNKLNYLIANASTKAPVKLNCKEFSTYNISKGDRHTQIECKLSCICISNYIHLEKTKTKRSTKKEQKHNAKTLNTIRFGAVLFVYLCRWCFFFLFILVHWCTQWSPTELVSRCRGTCCVILHKLFCAITREEQREISHTEPVVYVKSRLCRTDSLIRSDSLSLSLSHDIVSSMVYALRFSLSIDEWTFLQTHTHTKAKSDDKYTDSMWRIRVNWGMLWRHMECSSEAEKRTHTHIERGGGDEENCIIWSTG